MKNIAVLLAFFAVFVISGCGAEDEPYSFSPPSWIIGSWEDSTGYVGFVFSADSVQQVMNGVTTDFEECYGKSKGVRDETSGKNYTVYVPEVSAVYYFTLYSSTRISYALSANGSTSASIYLRKQ